MSRILCKVGGGGGKAPKGDAVPANVLAGKTFSNKDNVGLTGTMINRGAVTATIGAGETYAIGDGYHNGNGIITAKSLASETRGTATAPDILTGKTAWVNGVKVTGSIITQAGGTYNPGRSVKTLVSGGRYVSSDVKVNAFALPPASALKKGYKYTLYGQSVTGTFEGYTTSPLVIKNSGNKMNSKWTWSAIKGSPYYDSSNAIVLFEDDLVRIQPALNLTDYTQLYLRASRYPSTSTVYIQIGLDTSANKTSISSCKYHINGDKPSSGAGTTCYYNIASITGSYYLYLGIPSGELFYHTIKLT